MTKLAHKDWLFVANEDLAGAKRLASGQAIMSPAFFLTQQAAEKALKPYLLYKQQILLRTHDLVALLRECAKFELRFNNFATHAAQLNGYITSTRYPDDTWYVPDEITLMEAIKFAEEIVCFVESIVVE